MPKRSAIFGLCMLGAVLSGVVLSSAHAQVITDLPLQIDLPEDWFVTKTSKDYEYRRGFEAVSRDGGFLFIEEVDAARSSDMIAFPPIEGVQEDIPFSGDIAGFLGGYAVEVSGLKSFTFVSSHGNRAYRFRIGYNVGLDAVSEQRVEALQASAERIATTFRFSQ